MKRLLLLSNLPYMKNDYINDNSNKTVKFTTFLKSKFNFPFPDSFLSWVRVYLLRPSE